MKEGLMGISECRQSSSHPQSPANEESRSKISSGVVPELDFEVEVVQFWAGVRRSVGGPGQTID